MAVTSASFKLVIDKNGKRVLFAEGGKDLLNFLSSIIDHHIISEPDMTAGSVANFCNSATKDYLEPKKLIMVPTALFKCSKCWSYVFSDFPSSYLNDTTVMYKKLRSGYGMTYMVTDDLTVTPMSTIATINLLNKFNVKDSTFLEEMVVKIDIDQGHAVWMNVLTSKTVLTDIFRREID